MKTTKKKIAFTAFLTTLITLGIFIPIFWFNNNASPLGTFIHAQFTCLQSGDPIEGLTVTVLENGDVDVTDEYGSVTFGSGYAPGTYTLEWSWWDGTHSDAVTIDCSKQHWYFEYTVINPEVHKTFIVLVHGEPVPQEGLDVELVGYGIKTTDASGYVAWIVDYPFVDTALEWTWNGVPATEDVLWSVFDPKTGIWTKDNTLEPKSGGGNKLHLPEESGY